MELHVQALFTHDARGDLVRVNEPNGAPAPRFFLGKTVDGVVRRFRYDVGHDVRRELEAASEEDLREPHGLDAVGDPSRYEALLVRGAPIQRTWTGPAFSVPEGLDAPVDTMLVTEENAQVLQPHLQAWVPDARSCRPMVALTVDGDAVAVCCSVRRTDAAHEAGVETTPSHRGLGYAAHVVTAWARAVRAMGPVPLYSTSWRNEASRAVARKLALIHFGSDLHVT